ncbi:MAG: thioredoxin domain-containing protein [Bacteroidota bacterium]
MSDKPKHTNRLINASSPYLLQHAHNPIDWHEWSDEAFEKAKREDKLVLVSIGYSACHWCHVMEHECFEKEDTAAIMNAHFVCIKVDREERPDVDQIYMDAVQLLTGRGGWPLNCITLPDGRPIHAGTYFPKPEWEQLLTALADFYAKRKDEAFTYAEELTNGIVKMNIVPQQPSDLLSYDELTTILNNWKRHFDTTLGGYSWAPKFPMPNNWELFLQHDYYTGDEDMHKAVHATLTKMAEGGIYDQAGGGFARYSTDSLWKAPHFEKMLYDNGQLMSLYAHGYQQHKKELYRKVVYETGAFIIRELTAAEGAFYSALDADSEGVEGKFYIWSHKELIDLLGDNEPLFSLYYSIESNGNWEHDSNILYKTKSDAELETVTGKKIADIETIIHQCNQIVLQERSNRIRPGLDDKIITSWNALMIKGFADAYKVFGDEAFLSRATQCADFIIDTMLVNKKLYRIYKNGKTSIPAFAEDYALLSEALMTLYEVSGKERYLRTALLLMETAIIHFYNEDTTLFYFTSNEDAQLITRKTDMQDDVIPSANSTFAKCLYKLGFYFDKPEYHVMAKQMVKVVQPKFSQYTGSYTNWMQLLGWMEQGFYQIIITGKNTQEAYHECIASYIPNAIILNMNAPSTIPLLADKTIHEETNIYVCNDYTCSLPVATAEAALKQLL